MSATAVVCAGNVVLDLVFAVDELPHGGEKFRAKDLRTTTGGMAANAAVTIVRLGGAARLVARLGADDHAEQISAGLRDAGVDCSCVSRYAGCRTSCSSVYVDARGERQLVNFRDPHLPTEAALLDAALAEPFAAALADTRWPEAAAALMQAARAAGRPGVVDVEAPADLRMLDAASHLAFSAQGLREVGGADDLERALRDVAAATGAFVCVTQGADGVRFLHEGAVRHCLAYPVKAVDTLAAGDVWHGAFALGLGRKLDAAQAVDYASAAAALKCAAAGDWKALPRHEQVIELMASRS